MSNVELRRRLLTQVKKLPNEKLATVLNYVAFVTRDVENDEEMEYGPAFRKAMKDARAEFKAGRYITLDALKSQLRTTRKTRRPTQAAEKRPPLSARLRKAEREFAAGKYFTLDQLKRKNA